jgi:tRNA(fMet)-specific endonuclease VapC
MIVADTDVLIDFLASHGPAADRVGEELRAGRLCTTIVNRFELLCGAWDPKQEGAIRKLLAALPILPLDREATDVAAEVARDLKRRGETIGMADCLIAGIAINVGAAILTRNERHFGRVKRLAILPL